MLLGISPELLFFFLGGGGAAKHFETNPTNLWTRISICPTGQPQKSVLTCFRFWWFGPPNPICFAFYRGSNRPTNPTPNRRVPECSQPEKGPIFSGDSRIVFCFAGPTEPSHWEPPVHPGFPKRAADAAHRSGVFVIGSICPKVSRTEAPEAFAPARWQRTVRRPGRTLKAGAVCRVACMYYIIYIYIYFRVCYALPRRLHVLLLLNPCFRYKQMSIPNLCIYLCINVFGNCPSALIVSVFGVAQVLKVQKKQGRSWRTFKHGFRHPWNTWGLLSYRRLLLKSFPLSNQRRAALERWKFAGQGEVNVATPFWVFPNKGNYQLFTR